MKALVYTGPETLAFCESPDPEPGAGDVLLRVTDVGICGSDMHAWLGHDARRPAPLILGHEAAGVTPEGARLTVNPLVTCGVCADCVAGRDNLCAQRQIVSMPPREGAFAEWLSVPERNTVAVPDAVPTTKAALAEPLACGWHAVRLARRVLNPEIGDAVCLVLGGGAIGLGAALSLKAQGATEIWIAETNPLRHGALERAGPFRVFDPTAGGGPEAVDLIVDGVGIEATRRAATALARPGGVIAHIGLGSATGGLDVRRMTLQEITVIGTYTYTMQDFRDTAAAIFDGRMGPLDWAEHRSLSDGAAAFGEIRAGQVAAPKIMLHP